MEELLMIIYKVINLINNKIYIGQTIQTLRERKRRHISCAFVSNSNVYFHKALRKYGKENFKWEIIDIAETHEELNEKEKYWIALYNSFGENGYNCTIGGDATTGYKHTEESKEKMSKTLKENGALKGSNNPNSKLTEVKVLEIKELIKNGASLSEIARRFNTTYSIISKIKRGITWKNVGEDVSYIKYHLTEDEVREIKILLNEKDLNQKEIAKKFNVSTDVISSINVGRNWRNVKIDATI
jgi:group I intron endonuclease